MCAGALSNLRLFRAPVLRRPGGGDSGAGSEAGLNKERRSASQYPLPVALVTTDSNLRKSCYQTPGKGIGIPREKTRPRRVPG